MKLHGEVLGVPYDFRVPTFAKLKSHYWNPADERIFVPRAFGIGWDVNLFRLRARHPALFYALLAVTAMGTVAQWIAWFRRLRGRGEKVD